MDDVLTFIMVLGILVFPAIAGNVILNVVEDSVFIFSITAITNLFLKLF